MGRRLPAEGVAGRTRGSCAGSRRRYRGTAGAGPGHGRSGAAPRRRRDRAARHAPEPVIAPRAPARRAGGRWPASRMRSPGRVPRRPGAGPGNRPVGGDVRVVVADQGNAQRRRGRVDIRFRSSFATPVGGPWRSLYSCVSALDIGANAKDECTAAISPGPCRSCPGPRPGSRRQPGAGRRVAQGRCVDGLPGHPPAGEEPRQGIVRQEPQRLPGEPDRPPSGAAGGTGGAGAGGGAHRPRTGARGAQRYRAHDLLRRRPAWPAAAGAGALHAWLSGPATGAGDLQRLCQPQPARRRHRPCA